MFEFSFKLIRNFGLGLMLLLIVAVSIISYMTLDFTSDRIVGLLNTQNKKLLQWNVLHNEIHRSLIAFKDFRIMRSKNIDESIAHADKALVTVEGLQPYYTLEQDRLILEDLTKNIKIFRQAVFAYSVEVEKGYRGRTSAKEMEEVAHLSGEKVFANVEKAMAHTTVNIQKEFQTIFSEIKNANKKLLLVLLFSLIITFLNVVFMNKALVRPVNKLADASRAVAKGDLTQRVNINTNDEFGYLAGSFNSMIRELKQSRSELVEKEFVDSIISNMTDALIVIGLDGTIRTVNRATLDLLGYTSEELIGKPFEKVLEETGSGTGGSAPENMTGLDSTMEFEKHYKTKTGEVIPVNFSVSAMRDKKGRMAGLVSLATDIRQMRKYFEDERKLSAVTAAAKASQKRAMELEKAYGELEQSKEAALNIMEDLDQQTKELQTEIAQRKKTENELNKMYQEVQLLANLVENANEMVFVLKPDGSILKSNLMSRDVFGYSVQEMSEHKIMDLLKSGAELHWKGIIKQALKKLYWRGDLTAVCRDGRSFQANVAISSPAEEEEVTKSGNLLCFVRDVTREKEIDRMKSEFISTVSHELRTPLSITREGISLIRDRIPGEINKNQELLLTTAMDNIDRLARIINDLLDVSKIEAGRLELGRKVIDIFGLLQQVFLSFEPQVKSKGLQLRSDFPKRKVEIYADEDKISQVFINLIGNAIKFTEKGYIEIILIEKEDEVDCIVADTGVGISKEDMPKLFSKFQQFGRVAGPGEKGTGLGLSIVKDIIEMHGGRIEVNSALNKGTIFTITVPKYSTFNILKEHIKNGIKEAAGKYSSLSQISINIPNFKKVEKIMSKVKADKIFSALADGVRGLLRRTCDMLVEDHSDIFILLPDTEKKGALIVLDRIRQTFENYISTQDIKELKELRFNFNTINFPDDAKTYEDFIRMVKETKSGKENPVHRG